MSQRSRRRYARDALLAVALSSLAAVGAAEERIAAIRQGTNLAHTLAPDGSTLVIDLLGQLWSLPAAGGGATPLTAPGQNVRNPRFSPDGDTVVYQRHSDGQWDIWLLDLATHEQRALTSSPANEREPDFTADGRAVVFAADRTGHYCLWAITVEGGVETQLTEEPGDASYPSVSAQGAVAYAHARGNEDWSIRVLATNGASRTVHGSRRPLSAPSWRPGGGVLLFNEQETESSSRIWTLILGEPRVLKTASGPEDVFNSRAAWASAGEFIYAADGQLWRRELANQVRQPIYLFAAAPVTAAVTPSDLPWLDAPEERAASGRSGLARSADGRRAVFTALGDLWLVERDRAERLTDDSFRERDPALWPDGSAIVFSSDRTGQFELWRMTLPDRRLSQLTFGAVAPRQPAVSADGRQITYLEAQSFEPSAATRAVVLSWQGSAERPATATARATPIAPEALPPLLWRPAAPPADYVVEVGRLFDGTNATYRRHVDVHIRAGRIATVVARGMLPTSGEVVDARDLTVIPGLVDIHTHQIPLAGERLGRAWLAYGVTTLREIATDTSEALERAETWASGRARGPRLVVSPATPLPNLDPSLPLRNFAGTTLGFTHTLQEQARLLRFPHWVEATPGLTYARPEASAVELELSPTLTVYQDGVSRVTTSGTTIVAGLAALRGMPELGRAVTGPARRGSAYRRLFSAASHELWQQSAAVTRGTAQALERTVVELVRAGANLAVGSEAPALPFGAGTHLELKALVEAGIPSDQVLRAATMGGALALGLERQVGSVEAGKLADFIVLDGDPLADIEATLDIVAVVKGGVWHTRDSLLAP